MKSSDCLCTFVSTTQAKKLSGNTYEAEQWKCISKPTILELFSIIEKFESTFPIRCEIVLFPQNSCMNLYIPYMCILYMAQKANACYFKAYNKFWSSPFPFHLYLFCTSFTHVAINLILRHGFISPATRQKSSFFHFQMFDCFLSHLIFNLVYIAVDFAPLSPERSGFGGISTYVSQHVYQGLPPISFRQF